jgi:hypothetical protein
VGASNRRGPRNRYCESKWSQSFIEFFFIWLDNLSFVERRKLFFRYKTFILSPLRLCHSGRPHHSSTPPPYWSKHFFFPPCNLPVTVASVSCRCKKKKRCCTKVLSVHMETARVSVPACLWHSGEPVPRAVCGHGHKCVGCWSADFQRALISTVLVGTVEGKRTTQIPSPTPTPKEPT